MRERCSNCVFFTSFEKLYGIPWIYKGKGFCSLSSRFSSNEERVTFDVVSEEDVCPGFQPKEEV